MTPEEFWSIWQASEPDYKPVLFRLYYDNQGNLIDYSHDDRPGNYIDVDPEFFRLQPRNVKVVDNTLTIIDTTNQTKKLSPNIFGISCDVRDVCVIISKEPNTKWSLKTYEPD